MTEVKPTGALEVQGLGPRLFLTTFRGKVTLEMSLAALPSFERIVEPMREPVWISDAMTLTGFEPKSLGQGARAGIASFAERAAHMCWSRAAGSDRSWPRARWRSGSAYVCEGSRASSRRPPPRTACSKCMRCRRSVLRAYGWAANAAYSDAASSTKLPIAMCTSTRCRPQSGVMSPEISSARGSDGSASTLSAR